MQVNKLKNEIRAIVFLKQYSRMIYVIMSGKSIKEEQYAITLNVSTCSG